MNPRAEVFGRARQKPGVVQGMQVNAALGQERLVVFCRLQPRANLVAVKIGQVEPEARRHVGLLVLQPAARGRAPGVKNAGRHGRAGIGVRDAKRAHFVQRLERQLFQRIGRRAARPGLDLIQPDGIAGRGEAAVPPRGAEAHGLGLDQPHICPRPRQIARERQPRHTSADDQHIGLDRTFRHRARPVGMGRPGIVGVGQHGYVLRHPSGPDMPRARAAFDGGGMQAVDVQLVANFLKHPKFDLPEPPVG